MVQDFHIEYFNIVRDEELANKGGRVIEILSEHTCQGYFSYFVLYLFYPDLCKDTL